MNFLTKSIIALPWLLWPLLGTKAATLNIPGDYARIQDAINAAAAGDTVRVAAGTYPEALTWTGKDLILQGAGSGVSVIDPSAANLGPIGPTLTTSGLTPAARLQGFTITGGQDGLAYDEGWDAYLPDGSGGGMVNTDSSPTVADCVFTRSGSVRPGSGMSNVRSNPTVSNCTFDGDGMLNDGSNATISDCTFHAAGMVNLAGTPTITGSVFTQFGGLGIYNQDCPAPGVTISACTFDSNAGGMENWRSYSTIDRCIFTRNTRRIGAGMRNANRSVVTVSNSLFAYNHAPDPAFEGGAGMLNIGSDVRVVNCTIALNQGDRSGAGIRTMGGTVSLSNCILWGNRATFSGADQQNFDSYLSSVTLSHSLIETSTVFPGVGNLNSDPLFVDAANGNFHLQASSPALETGDSNAVLPGSADLDGLARISGLAVDLGCFEAFVDSEPPVITTAGNLTAMATSAAGAPVVFSPTANDNVDGPVAVTCSPASGTVFPLGTTTVQCTATDAAGNAGTASFTVTVVSAFQVKSVVVSLNGKGKDNDKDKEKDKDKEDPKGKRKGSVVTVNFVLRNAGAILANNVSLSVATLQGITTETHLPLNLPRLGAGAQTPVELKFENVPAGPATFVIRGTSSAGPIQASVTVQIP